MDGRLAWEHRRAMGGRAILILCALAFAGCADCLAIGCDDSLSVTVTGVASGEFTIRVEDRDGAMAATRSCDPTSCPSAMALFPDFDPTRIEITVTVGEESRSQTFTVDYEELRGACADCRFGQVTFAF